MQELKDRIKLIRKELEIPSQRLLAIKMGVNEDRVKSIEAGRVKKLHENELELLVNDFNINRSWLTKGEGSMYNHPPQPLTINKRLNNHISEIELEILEAYRSLPAKRQKLFYHKIKAEAIEYENSDLEDVKYA